MATYYGVNAGGNWSAGATWSTVAAKGASRTAGATQPTAADDCVLDDYSGNVTVDTTTCLCKTLSCTVNGNYAGTLTFTAAKTLAAAGNATLYSGMTIAGTGALKLNGAATLISAGLTLPNLYITGSAATALSGTCTVSGTTTINGGFTGQSLSGTLNTVHLTIGFGMQGGTAVITVSGTLTGTGPGNAQFNLPCTSLTMLTGSTMLSNMMTGALVIQSGVTATGGTLTTVGAVSINSASSLGAVVIGGYSGSATSTLTLLSDIRVNSSLQSNSTPSNITAASPFKVQCYGNLTLTSQALAFTGSAYPEINGGTWSGSGVLSVVSAAGVVIAGNVTINSVTVGGTSTLTYTSGTLAGNKNITLAAAANVTFNTANMTWGSITNSGSATLTLAADMVCTNLTTLTGFALTIVPNGHSVTLATLSVTGGSMLLSAASYNIYATTVWVNGRDAGPAVITNSSGTVTLNNAGGSANRMYYAALTNVASATATLYNWQGTCTTCTNIKAITDVDIDGGGIAIYTY